VGDTPLNRRIELPRAWELVLERIRSVLPSAYLAGGAIRDFDNARAVKDFDVFFTEGFDNINYLEDRR
jgi:tRNA nucleotidyltransferase/poly(A) polymerase